MTAVGFFCHDGDIRLVGDNCSSEIYEGRVEVCQNSTFFTVCDDGNWGEEEATVVCRQLNFTNGSECDGMRGE